jgi:hypothetical protein
MKPSGDLGRRLRHADRVNLATRTQEREEESEGGVKQGQFRALGFCANEKPGGIAFSGDGVYCRSGLKADNGKKVSWVWLEAHTGNPGWNQVIRGSSTAEPRRAGANRRCFPPDSYC